MLLIYLQFKSKNLPQLPEYVSITNEKRKKRMKSNNKKEC